MPIRDPPQNKRPTQTESESWKNTFQANGWDKKAGTAILISDNIDSKQRREGHSIILKGRIHQEDITIVNIYAPNTQINKENFEGLQER